MNCCFLTTHEKLSKQNDSPTTVQFPFRCCSPVIRRQIMEQNEMRLQILNVFNQKGRSKVVPKQSRLLLPMSLFEPPRESVVKKFFAVCDCLWCVRKSAIFRALKICSPTSVVHANGFCPVPPERHTQMDHARGDRGSSTHCSHCIL